MKLIFLNLLIFVFCHALSAQNFECLTCLIGKSVQDKDVKDFLLKTEGQDLDRDLTVGNFGLENSGGLIHVNKAGFIDLIEINRSKGGNFSDLKTSNPELIKLLQIESTYKATKKSLTYNVIDLKKFSHCECFTLIYSVPIEGGTPLIVSVDWSFGEWIKLTLKYEGTPKVLPVKKCASPCSVKSFSNIDLSFIDNANVIDLWTIKALRLNQSDLEQLDKLNNYHKTDTYFPTYERNDGSFSFWISNKSSTEPSLVPSKVNINKYTGELPFGITRDMRYEDLEKKFGINMIENTSTRELTKNSEWPYVVTLSSGDHNIELFFYGNEDNQNPFAELISIWYTGVDSLLPSGIKLDQFKVSKHGCQECEKGDSNDGICSYIFARKGRMRVEMKYGKPVKRALNFSENATINTNKAISKFEKDKADALEKERQAMLKEVTTCKNHLKVILIDLNEQLLVNYNKINKSYIQGLREIKANPNSLNRITEETKKNMNFSVSSWETAYNSMGRNIELAKLVCDCPEYAQLIMSIEFEYEHYFKTMQSAVLLMKDFYFGENSRVETNMGSVSNSTDRHNNSWSSFILTYNNHVQECD